MYVWKALALRNWDASVSSWVTEWLFLNLIQLHSTFIQFLSMAIALCGVSYAYDFIICYYCLKYKIKVWVIFIELLFCWSVKCVWLALHICFLLLCLLRLSTSTTWWSFLLVCVARFYIKSSTRHDAKCTQDSEQSVHKLRSFNYLRALHIT